jgi:hypothetical protein
MALWGAAGVPLGNAIVGEAVENLNVNMTPEDREKANQGILGSLVVYGLNSEVEVAPRLAPFGQLEQLVRDLVFDEVPLAERMAGVAGSLVGRFGDAFVRLRPMIMASMETGSFTREDLMMGLSIIGQIPSASRGLLKAHIMNNNHKILDRHGNIVVPRNFNWETEVGAALGFRPIVEAETRQSQLAQGDDREKVAEAADVVLDLMHMYLNSADTDPLAGRKIQAAMTVILDSFANPLLKAEVRASVERKMDKEDSVRAKVVKRFFETTAPEDIVEGARIMEQGFFSRATGTRAIVDPIKTTGDSE